MCQANGSLLYHVVNVMLIEEAENGADTDADTPPEQPETEADNEEAGNSPRNGRLPNDTPSEEDLKLLSEDFYFLVRQPFRKLARTSSFVCLLFIVYWNISNIWIVSARTFTRIISL